MQDWHVLDLQQLRPEAAAWELVRRWTGPKLTVWQDDLPVIAVRQPDQMISTLSKNHRSTLRRSLRRAEKEALTFELADSPAAEEAAHRLVALHREMWQGRAISPEHLSPRFQAHLGAAVQRLSAAGLGGVVEFRYKGRVIISSLLIFGGGYVGTYLQGATEGMSRDYQISALYIWDALKRACDRKLSQVSLLRGLEPYKLRWRPMIVSNRRAILGRRWFWALYAGYRLVHARARRLVESGAAPRWLVVMTSGYRMLARFYRSLKLQALAR
jgi:CelD/BcsL family acetyltransferase involved in cellulose biosynthesis